MKAMARTTVELSTLTPDSLAALNERQFRIVVQEDMKRNAANEKIRRSDVPEWLSRALRETHVERWVSCLEAMLASVEGQIALKEIELEQAKAGGTDVNAVLNTMGAPTRFRSALLEVLPEARRLAEGRVMRLEEAIIAHRSAVEADVSVSPSAADRRLWTILDH